jgi:hypothetical protein
LLLTLSQQGTNGVWLQLAMYQASMVGLLYVCVAIIAATTGIDESPWGIIVAA